MSYEGRVTSSEMTFKVIQIMGNTHIWRRGSGYSAVLSKPCASRHRTGMNAMDSWNEGTGKLYGDGVYVSRHLSLGLYRKASIQKTNGGRDQNRTREIRLSGIAGRLTET